MGVMEYLPLDHPINHPDMDPIWQATQDAGLCVTHHSHSSGYPGYRDLWSNPYLGRSASHPWEAMRMLAAFLGAGIMERFPTLLEQMKDGAILANSGHFDVELDVAALREMAAERRLAREHVEEYVLPSGKRIYLLAEGRLVGHAVGEASPEALMDMSFANQALSTEYLVYNGQALGPRVYDVPSDTDRQVAELKLDALGIQIDRLSEQQEHYLHSWRSGT